MGSRLICQSCLPELAEELLLPFRVRWGEEGSRVTLLELSCQYRQSGDLLRQRLRQLRKLKRTCTGSDPETAWHLQRRIGELTELLRQTNELEALTAHYYERGYTRNEKYTL